jgi:hypothetical protein
MLKVNKSIFVVLGLLLLSGCGDQMWCGDDGCNASSSKTISQLPVTH